MKQLILRSVPTGSLAETDFELQEAEIPKIGEGQVLIKNMKVYLLEESLYI